MNWNFSLTCCMRTLFVLSLNKWRQSCLLGSWETFTWHPQFINWSNVPLVRWGTLMLKDNLLRPVFTSITMFCTYRSQIFVFNFMSRVVIIIKQYNIRLAIYQLLEKYQWQYMFTCVGHDIDNSRSLKVTILFV